MNSADAERLAGLQDSLILAAHGPTFELDWAVEVEGVELKCHYWNGPFNDNRVLVSVPLADPSKVCGRDCHSYLNGIRQPYSYWRDYPEDDDPDNRNNFHHIPGGPPHGPYCSFEVVFQPDDVDGWVLGKPSGSPFDLQDPSLEALCDYSYRDEITGERVPFVRFKPHVSRAVIHSWRQAVAEKEAGRVAVDR